MAKQANDTFIADMPDGTQKFVAKGTVFSDREPVVKQVPGMFDDYDLGEDEKAPAKSEPGKAAPKAAPVKAAKPADGKAS